MENPFQIISQRLSTIEQLLLDLKHQKPTVLEEKPDKYVNKKEAANLAGVSTSTIDNWGRSGKITRHYFGGSVRFWLPELLDFLKKQKVGKS
ncbi:MAG: hypothetical protein KDC53_15475 [Saprospiraceae bacterium]|nr:hypothetical protein [Saprospiraceae bacterium]